MIMDPEIRIASATLLVDSNSICRDVYEKVSAAEKLKSVPQYTEHKIKDIMYITTAELLKHKLTYHPESLIAEFLLQLIVSF